MRMYRCKMKLLCVLFVWCVVVVCGGRFHHHKPSEETTTTEEQFDLSRLQFENEEQRREFKRVLNNINSTRGSGTYLKINLTEPVASANRSTFRFPLFHDDDDAADDTPVIHKIWYRRRVKRFTVDQQMAWYDSNITWSLFTQLLPFTRDVVVKELTDAFYMWENTTTWRNQTMLRFIQLPDNDTSANIKIHFERGDHNDSFPFDGPNGVMAHTFLPPYGRIHFDADEEWNLRYENNTIPEDGISLFLVAAHEIGHALGFYHSSVRKAIMFSFYNSANYKLTVDDLNGLNQLYSDNPFRTTTTTTTTTTTAPFTTTAKPVIKPMNSRNLIFERVLPLWLWRHSLTKRDECVAPPSNLMMLGDRLHLMVAGKVWSYDKNGTIHYQGVPLMSLWHDLCNADAMVAIDNVVIATYKNVWYEYDDKGVLMYVGRVQDVLDDVTRVDTFVLERDDDNMPRLYATYGNKFYVLDLATRHTVYSGPLHHKFRGVGARMDYFVHFPDSQTQLVGLARGVWSVRVIAVDPVLGNVYQAVKGVQRLLQQC
ncbi:mp-nase [Spodoptera frugiperda granulovirus]|uniref:Mp-nase n=1 Tax=Spodoptera frugiperda granulovirus TaxID=307454 RepID=A0A0C5B309_9BBAC|nr:mp-nase [Spodoptera frugiperda granulovirus]AJK91695.1 mp-nase [Spodoptera frugiperda granulovirus]